jgi:hypothetical protein
MLRQPKPEHQRRDDDHPAADADQPTESPCGGSQKNIEKDVKHGEDMSARVHAGLASFGNPAH